MRDRRPHPFYHPNDPNNPNHHHNQQQLPPNSSLYCQVNGLVMPHNSNPQITRPIVTIPVAQTSRPSGTMEMVKLKLWLENLSKKDFESLLFALIDEKGGNFKSLFTAINTAYGREIEKQQNNTAQPQAQSSPQPPA